MTVEEISRMISLEISRSDADSVEDLLKSNLLNRIAARILAAVEAEQRADFTNIYGRSHSGKHPQF